MKDEIKEILDNIKNKYEDYYVQDIVSGNDLKLLLDYITNLQEELETTQQKWDKDKQFVECRTKEWLDYKSRNEKAIEYIKEHRRADLVFKLYLTEQETDNVLNILQGGDK